VSWSWCRRGGGKATRGAGARFGAITGVGAGVGVAVCVGCSS
jgi:hypothetical protein